MNVPLRLFAAVLAVTLAATVTVPTGVSHADAPPTSGSSLPVDLLTVEAPPPATFTSRLESGVRSATPEDRYALAGGCYELRAVDLDEPIARGDGTFVARTGADGEPFHLQATDLGTYLLYGSVADFLAVDEGALRDLLEAFTGSSPIAIVDGITRGLVEEIAELLATGPLGEASGYGSVVIASPLPSDLAVWEVTEDRGAFRLELPAIGAALATADDGELVLTAAGESGDRGLFGFELTDGCAEWPEIEVNVDGAVVGGPTPYGGTRGYLDAHLHWMAFEFLGGRARCGQPWHPFGPGYALQDCPEHEDFSGRTNVLEFALSGSVDPIGGQDTAGWPTFSWWPAHDLLTYEQSYYRWVERTWRGGLRLLVNLLVDNYVLCELYPFKVNSCNEMEGVFLQAERIRELERYIDAQHGGPGQGWLRIVGDPFEAREVMNEGRLAVVLGIEVSRPFDCRLLQGVPLCDEDQIELQLDEVYDIGVRQMELVNKFDNALTGVKGDAGETGVIVNLGNVVETGRFWQMQTCEEEHGHGHEHGDGNAHDNHQHNIHDTGGTPEELTGRDALVGEVLQATGGSGAAPLYPAGPHCNTMGLTELGEHALEGLMARGMIFDPDHMSAPARHESMEFIEAAGYSGVVSSHSWADDIIYQRILRAGGVVTPMAGSSTRFVDRWRSHREWADDRFLFGFGFGSDINGFASQGAPRNPEPEDALDYPFTGFGGVEVHQQVSGERVFDFNVDGVAHYGMYADWLEDIRLVAGEDGDTIIEDMQHGPEAYLQMWERAIGIAPDACRPDVEGFGQDAIDGLEPGMTPEEVLRELGQPNQRHGDTFRYCLADGSSADIRFDADGQLLLAVADDPAPPLPATGGGIALALLLVLLAGLAGLRRIPLLA